MKHLPFPGTDDINKYNAYMRSHKWQIIFHDSKLGLGITQECKCGTILQNPNETICFRFGCSIAPNVLR